MKICRFESAHGPSFGRVVDDVVVPLSGEPFSGIIEAGPPAPLAAIKWLPPTVPSTFFCAGLNYRRHITEAKAKGYAAARLPDRPDVGHRANNALIGHGEAIIMPSDYEGRFEYEAELVAVIGKPLRRASRYEAEDGIFGWTIGNDVSARAWQHNDRTMWRGKNADTFKPMGPWIETEAEPMDAHTFVRVNGDLKSRFATGDMIFSAIDFIVEVTRYITMKPGDVLWLGTDGVGAMAPGDRVEIEIEGVGVLGNPVILEPDVAAFAETDRES